MGFSHQTVRFPTAVQQINNFCQKLQKVWDLVIRCPFLFKLNNSISMAIWAREENSELL